MTERRPRIFVQIASYRDRECQWTVRDLFAKARIPERVFVGICWQFDAASDADCFLVETRPQQVRRVDFRIEQAQGLGWARAQAQALWRGEEYTLQIDSHMRFVEHWDERMLEEWSACPSRKPVLTVYPPSYWPPNELQELDAKVAFVQGVERFSPSGVLQYGCHSIYVQTPAASPYPCAGLAGGFVFGASTLLRDVPSDPEIYFEGEEPNLAVRLWTHGYDLFSPRAPLLYHYYRRTDSRRPWNDASFVRPHERSLARLRRLFEPTVGDDLGCYGLGDVRSLREYELFAGVDFRAKTVASFVHHYPFVYSDEVTTALIGLAPLAPSPNTQLFMADDAAVLCVGHRGAFYRLAPAAAYCWCAIENGMACGDIVAALAKRTGEPIDAARRQVHSTIAHWQNLGALRTEHTSGVRGFGAPTVESPESKRTWTMRPEPADRETIRSFDVLGRVLDVVSYGDRYDVCVADACAHLAPSAASIEPADRATIVVLGVGPYHYVARDDAFPPTICGDIQTLCAAIIAAVDAAILEAPDTLFLLRANLSAGDGGVTLCVGDEASLAGHPGLGDARLVQLIRRSHRARIVPRAHLRPPVAAEAWPVVRIVFLSENESAHRLAPIDALARLVGGSVTRSRRYAVEDAAELVAFLERVPCEVAARVA